jgi:hypothetical protein
MGRGRGRTITGSAWAIVLLVLALPFAPNSAFAQASPSPYTNATRYDAAGRVVGTISADPDTVGGGNPFLAVRNSYDQAGRLLKVESGTLSVWQSEAVAPSSWTGFTVSRTVETQYDAMNRKLREWAREGAAGTVRTMTEYSYDAVGRLSCTAVRMNPALFAFSLTPLPMPAFPTRRAPKAPTVSHATSTTPPDSACSCAWAWAAAMRAPRRPGPTMPTARSRP